MGIEATAQAQFPDARADRRWLSEVATSDAALRQVLHGLPGVDQVGTEARAAGLATRSIKRDAKLQALDMAVRMVDLTTLEGADTPGKVRGHVRQGAAARIRPTRRCRRSPPCASTRTWSAWPGPPCQEAQARAAPWPSPRWPPRSRPAGPRSRSSWPTCADAVAAGADEVDMVIDRGAFLAGRYGQVYEEVRQVREACGPAHLKVILETAELATLDNVSRASWLAMLAGADFIKTSTGKVSPAATPPVALVMLAAVRDYAQATGRRVGVKVAGGVRTAKDAIRYLVLVRETAGPEWLTPALFRIGASSLLNDLLMQRSKQLTGRYAGPDYFTVD